MTLFYFILILSVTVFIHELGHFIFAKRAGIYVYEFAVGMGPKLFSFRRKNDETVYALRLIPLGGFCQLAGEEIEEDEDIPADKRLQSKTWMQRFLTIIAGCMFNFLLAIILLFIVGLFYGSPELKPYISETTTGYPANVAGVENGDLILRVNGHKVSTIDDVFTKLDIAKKGSAVEFEVKKENGDIEEYTIKPLKEEKNGEASYKFGLLFTDKVNHGFVEAVKYSFNKFAGIFRSMIDVIGSLITGALGINNLAGPVGIYKIVGESAKAGFENVLYLIAFLSVNVGFVNFLPFPAFDGGRLLFLIIEKIKGSRVNPRVENIIHAIGFALLILLMIIITIQDITKL